MKIFTQSRLVFSVLTLLTLTSFGNNKYPDARKKPKSPQEKQTARNFLSNQPVQFLENKGQMYDASGKTRMDILFKAEAPGVDLYVTEKGLSYVFLKIQAEENEQDESFKEGHLPGEESEKIKIRYEKLDFELLNANISRKNMIASDTDVAYTNYLMPKGQDNFMHLKKYKKITFKNVYNGIDWVLYNSNKYGFEYDFIVHPGADPSQIQMLYKSRKPLVLNENGMLSTKYFNGKLIEKEPYSYLDASQTKIESSYKIINTQKRNGLHETLVGFNVMDYPNNEVLIIDPQIVWATFFGGTSFEGTWSIDSDTQGNMYITGYNGNSPNYPLLSQGTYFQASYNSGLIIKFNNSGVLLWSTYFGSPSGGVSTNYINCDVADNLYITGTTGSPLFPTLNNNIGYFQAAPAGSNDAFITKFDPAGNIIWSTYLGGAGSDVGTCLGNDKYGNVFLYGSTTSPNFPLMNAGTYFDNTFSITATFISKFNSNGVLLWSTYIDGPAAGQQNVITVDKSGSVLITGNSTNTVFPTFNPGAGAYFQAASAGGMDAIIMKFSNSGNLLWSTFYGGSTIDNGCSIVTDKFNNIYVTGPTNSTNFPVQNSGGFFQASLSGTLSDAYVLKFDSNGVRKWATYFGGTRNETFQSYDNISIDSCGNFYISFNTQSRNVPLQQGCDGGYYKTFIDTTGTGQGISANSKTEGFFARFNSNNQLTYATYVGGDGTNFRTPTEVDKFGNIFVNGEWVYVTNNASYPLANPGGGSYFANWTGFDDIFVIKISNNPPAQTFTYGAYCKSDTTKSIKLPANFISGGTFSSTPTGLSLNPGTGTVNYSTSNPGTYTVNYLMAPCYCAGSTPQVIGSATIEIRPSPTLSIAGPSTICVKNKATYTVSGASNYTWSTGANTTTISITPTVSANFTYSVKGTNTLICDASKTFTVVVSKCTGIEDIEQAINLRVYPNPNNGAFEILSDYETTLVITNELGQNIKQLKVEPNKTAIINGFSPGIYFVKDLKYKDAKPYKIIVE